MTDTTFRKTITLALAVEAGDAVEASNLFAGLEARVASELPTGARIHAGEHRFGAPPEPVANPSAAWCDAYAEWYHQGLN